MQKLVKITVSSSSSPHKKGVAASCTMNKSKNHSEEPKIFQQAASQLMERLFCCSSSCPHSQVYDTSTEYHTSSDAQQQQQDLNASFLTGNSLLASTTFTEDEHNTSMSSTGLDLMSRSTGDKTLLFSQPQQSSPHNPHAPGGFLFLDGSASPPSSVRRRHHQRHNSHNSLSSTSLSIGTPPQHVYDTFAVLQRNETATTASVSSDDDMTQPSQIPAIQSSQTFDDDDDERAGETHHYEDVGDGVWNDYPTEPTPNFVTPSKAACTSPIPSLSALRAAKQKSKQLTRDNLDVRRVQAEFAQRSPHTKEPQFPC